MNPERPVPYLSVPFLQYGQRESDGGWDFIPKRVHLRCEPDVVEFWHGTHTEVMRGRASSPTLVNVSRQSVVTAEVEPTERAFVAAGWIPERREDRPVSLQLEENGDVRLVIEVGGAEAPITTDPLRYATWLWLGLYWSTPDDVRDRFRDLAREAPDLALDVLESGIEITGADLQAHSRALLDALGQDDLAVLLESSDRADRIRAQGLLPHFAPRRGTPAL